MDPEETFTLAELKATEDDHSAYHDGYCYCSKETGESLYDIDHIADVIRKNRQNG